MNELKVFESTEFGKVRTIEINGVPYFVGKDVAEILGYAETANMRKLLEKEEYIEINPQSPDFKGFVQNGMTFEPNPNIFRMLLVNESGLYNAIFNSTLPKAKDFKRWVFDDVLPSIRKTGKYSITDKPDSYTISDPAERARRWIEEYEERKQLEAKNNELKTKIEADKPKVVFADGVAASKGSILIGDLAKLIQQNGVPMGQKRLFEYLRQNGYLIKSGSSKNMPTQRYLEQGLFEVKISTVINPDGSNRETKTTKVTGKGQIYFVNLFLQSA